MDPVLQEMSDRFVPVGLYRRFSVLLSDHLERLHRSFNDNEALPRPFTRTIVHDIRAINQA